LAADDPAFDGNSETRGAVAVHQNYLVAMGLRDAGFVREAQALTRRLARAMIEKLQSDHMLSECHGPDSTAGGIRRFGIRAGVISKMIWDMKNTSGRTP
jgi:glycogen debranching enzyme